MSKYTGSHGAPLLTSPWLLKNLRDNIMSKDADASIMNSLPSDWVFFRVFALRLGLKEKYILER
jgi:hypothetical protein